MIQIDFFTLASTFTSHWGLEKYLDEANTCTFTSHWGLEKYLDEANTYTRGHDWSCSKLFYSQ
jgi:hypothetical protein